MTEAVAGMKPSVCRMMGAAIGALTAWYAGLPPIAQALLMTQGADVLTGILGALMGKSRKTESGKLASKTLAMGMVKKGLEWLVVLIGMVVGEALALEGIGGAAMTYMIATELVSLMENLNALGLNAPILERLLDAATSKD